MKKLCCILFLAFAVFAAKAQDIESSDTAKTPVKVKIPANYTTKMDVVYSKVDGWDGRMDLYQPSTDKGLSPVMINIHGGGWNKGRKEDQSGFSAFFKKGYVVANVEYRLVQTAPAPAAVLDIRCALIYIIDHARELNVDVNKIVIMGSSAGAHLALMGGLLANDHHFDTNCQTTKTIKVAAIISQSGITDVWDWAHGPHRTSKSATMWLDKRANDQPFAQSVSPLTYVKKDSPPTFVVHGDADPIVPYEQGVELYQKLQQMGVKSQFITVPGGGHGKFPAEKKTEIVNAYMAFLKELGLHQ
ncbi:alpha/beta fold hydrolase [Mucilaginibacter sp. AW1-3]